MESIPKREYHLDIIRIAAAFMVIMVHVCEMVIMRCESVAEYLPVSVFDTVAVSGVALFVMISGALFLDEKKEITIKKMYGKYILRLVAVLYFWSLIYSIKSLFQWGVSVSVIKNTIYAFLIGNAASHFWYLLMIIGIYAVLPIIKPGLSGNKSNCLYVSIITILFFSLIPTVFSFDIPGSSFVTEVLSYYPFTMFALLPGIFVLGYYINKFLDEKKEKLVIIVSAVTAVCVCAVNVCYFAVYNEKLISLASLNSPAVIALATMTFILVKRAVRGKEGLKGEKVISFVSSLTLGIYAIHLLLLHLTRTFVEDLLLAMPVLFIPLWTLVIFVLSGLIIYIFRLIPKIGKYLT